MAYAVVVDLSKITMETAAMASTAATAPNLLYRFVIMVLHIETMVIFLWMREVSNAWSTRCWRPAFRLSSRAK
jgi:hypothetical protein